MFMPKEYRKAIYTALFKDGVMVARKDHRPIMHCELKTIPNLYVVKTLKSLLSKNYVKETFSWNTYYWTLTNDGIIYLRDFLHLPMELVPTTLIQRARATRALPNIPREMAVGESGFKSRFDDGRETYRHQPRQYGDKRGDVGAGTGELEFRGGFGRGKRND